MRAARDVKVKAVTGGVNNVESRRGRGQSSVIGGTKLGRSYRAEVSG